MNRFLFLDVDGVLNTHRSLFSKFAEHYNLPHSIEDFSEKYWNSVDGTNPELMEMIDEMRKSKAYSFPDTSMYNFPFDDICIENCNQIIKENDCGVVVISTWRIGRTLEELQELFGEIGLKCKVIGRTAKLETRAEEIYDWIKHYQNKYDYKIESICIIDDDHSYDIDYMFYDYTVKHMTSIRNGLLEKHIPESKVVFSKPFDINQIELK